ncbi:DUF559 domain-containing protein [Nocardioides sp. NPDC057577]|uniref:DUF559 domain-containing protein n=1 Tax=Nocardioides sp. NPDC057577 TaxID=3346171 RepID=UPI00366B4888
MGDTSGEDFVLDTSRPFSRADAAKAKLKPSTLRGPRFVRLFSGVYVAADAPPTPLQRVQAALVPFRGNGFASHASAARVYGVPIPTLPDEHVTVTAGSHRRTHPGIVCHVLKKPRAVVLDGIGVSSPDQLFAELGSQVSLVDLVVAGDHLVRHHRGVTPATLADFSGSGTLPGSRLAATAAGYVRDKVRSPMETRLRMLIVLAGLPEPRINVLVGTGDGMLKREHDLVYVASKTVVEYDGKQHPAEQWERDLERREEADDDGWRILTVVAKGLFRRPDLTVAKIHRVLLERGEPGVPKRLSDAWRPHFPVIR